MRCAYYKVLLYLVPIIAFVNADYLYPTDSLKSKIAILHKIDDDFRKLKSNDRVFVGDGIRIFIQPQVECFFYIVYSDLNSSQLLNGEITGAELNPFRLSSNHTLLLPSAEHFYIFDDSEPGARITIIGSLMQIDDIEKLFIESNAIDSEVWLITETIISEKFSKPFQGDVIKPIQIAGNVSAINEEFLENQIYLIGEQVIIRKYNIEIKK
ncbi:MAG: hypothetical protein ACW99A_10360 [Candidatus Kariarchaeaceae archaeon]|jgi:hypothetical protein